MQETTPPWVPCVREYVQVRATGATGEVIEVVDTGAGPQFVVAIWPAPDSSPTAQSVAHRFCTLDELAPAGRP